MRTTSCLIAMLMFTALFVVGCEDDGTTTPTGTTVIIYQDTSFRGDSRAVPNSQPNLDDLIWSGAGGSS